MRLRCELGCVLAAVAIAIVVRPPDLTGQVLRVAEMTADEIARLDRDRTVVLLPGGILEEHGPHLPAFADGYWNERLTQAVAEAVAARPGGVALVFPTIPLGNSGANDIGGRFVFPGTYTVRFATLRAVFMDLATELGEQGFRRIFVLHSHGAPNHNRALDQAGDYFRDTYGGFMVNVGGLLPVMEAWDGAKSEAERAADGLPIHSGMDETSWMLYLRPHLVRPSYRTAPRHPGDTMDELVRLAQDSQWQGYFGAPDLASAAHGARIWQAASNRALDLIGQIMDGSDPWDIPRFGDAMLESEIDQRLDRASLVHEARIQRRQEEWLLRHKH